MFAEGVRRDKEIERELFAHCCPARAETVPIERERRRQILTKNIHVDRVARLAELVGGLANVVARLLAINA